jgi:hypothetical protein
MFGIHKGILRFEGFGFLIYVWRVNTGRVDSLWGNSTYLEFGIYLVLHPGRLMSYSPIYDP